MPSAWRAILQIDSPADRDCLRFGDITVVDPIQITVMADDPAVQADAKRLFVRLRSSLQTLAGGGSGSPDPCDGPRGLACMARNEASCRSVLVPLTGNARISSALENAMRLWTQTRPINSIVLPILPANAAPSVVLPSPLDRLTVLFHRGTIEHLAPDVLRAAGVGGREYRLFISYRRDDAQELAEQLHDELTHAGFHVFLDRFRGIPGTPFPAQLRRELADKGVVLVIESPLIALSSWTLAEVSFARALGLGLLALRVPGAPRFAAIPPSARIEPVSGWLSAPSGRPMLDPSTVQKVVDAMRQRYARHALYRQIYLENLLHGALAPHGLSAAAAGGGAFRIEAKKKKKKRSYVVQLSPRLPELGELRRVVTKARPPAACAVLVGASGLLAPEDREDLDWTASELSVALHPESRLRRLAKLFRNGTKLP